MKSYQLPITPCKSCRLTQSTSYTSSRVSSPLVSGFLHSAVSMVIACSTSMPCRCSASSSRTRRQLTKFHQIKYCVIASMHPLSLCSADCCSSMTHHHLVDGQNYSASPQLCHHRACFGAQLGRIPFAIHQTCSVYRVSFLSPLSRSFSASLRAFSSSWATGTLGAPQAPESPSFTCLRVFCLPYNLASPLSQFIDRFRDSLFLLLSS